MRESDNRETIADIVAEMRCGNFDAVNAVRCGYYNEIKTLMKNLADRIHAARQRERNANSKSAQVEFCNMAKMREGCVNIVEYARSARCYTDDAHVLGFLYQIERWAQAALAAPPRNCDLYNTPEESIRMFETYIRESGKVGFINPFTEVVKWLLSPAAERKGEGK